MPNLFYHFMQFLVKEGDTVEPGNKVAIISKSADAVSHVAPSEKIPEKATPKPSPPAEEPKVESTKAAEKPKASPPPSKQSAKEPQLPPKDRERRVCKLCHLVYTSILCL